MAVLCGGEAGALCDNRIYPMGMDSLYPAFNSVPSTNAPLSFYHTPQTTTDQLQDGSQDQVGVGIRMTSNRGRDATGHTLERPSLGNRAPFPQPKIGISQGSHLGSTPPTPGIPHTVSPTSPKPTAEAQLLQEDASPKNVSPMQLFPESQAYQVDNSRSPRPTVQARHPQALANNLHHVQQDRFGEDESCPQCSQFWFIHCECIFATTQDCEGNGQHPLHTSFQNLKRHIQEHWAASGTPCCLCQNHFSKQIGRAHV